MAVQPELFRSVAVIGANGQTGRFFTETLSRVVADVTPVVRGGIEVALKKEPEAVILAVPNPIDGALRELSANIKKPTTLILTQNGVGIAKKAEEILAGIRDQVTIVRASLGTVISQDPEDKKKIIYRTDKKRIAFSLVGEDRIGGLSKAESTLRHAGFEVKEVTGTRSMEWTKLLMNLVGSTAIATGLSPRETFSNWKNFCIEVRAIRDGFKILKAAGIPVADLWGIGKLRLLSRFPIPITGLIRSKIADMFAKERNNQPPAAARQITEGAKTVEAADYYLKPILDLAGEYGIESPGHAAILDVLKRHEHNKHFDLRELTVERRRELLLRAYAAETKKIFFKRNFFTWLKVSMWFRLYAGQFIVEGKELLNDVAGCLRHGRNVLILYRHSSHADHPAVERAVSENLPKDVRRCRMIIIANDKFAKERISRENGDAYPYLVVYTPNVADDDDRRWEGSLINARSNRALDTLLQEPTIILECPEGGRAKKFTQDGRPIMGPPAPQSSILLKDSRFDIAVATDVRGTEGMLPYQEQKPRRVESVIVKFLKIFQVAELKRRATEGDFKDRIIPAHVVLEEIAKGYPDDQKGPYRGS